MSVSAYLAFCGLCVVLALTPGPDTLLVLRYSLRRAGAGISASAGSALGNVAWATLVGFGLAALIAESAAAYRTLKIVGGLYLIYLGIQAFRSRQQAPVDGGEAAGAAPAVVPPALLSAFSAGLLSCVTNPKTGLFYIAVVPQFLPTGGSAVWFTMLLGATVAVIMLAYLVALCLAAAKANEWLKRPRVTRNLERSSGAILAGLGVGTAASAAAI
jgi:threonine/homoserine/homoserine lactone efflux protein